MTGQEIVKALRCCAKGLGHDDACENCKVGEIQDRREYIEFAAANVIERLTAENVALREGASLGKVKRPQKIAYEKSIEFLRAVTDGQSDEIKRLRRELEWKDRVIALAQRKQAEAEAERDALIEQIKERHDCMDCKHNDFCEFDGADGDIIFDCMNCMKEGCPCAGCCDSSCWEWRGLPEESEEGEKA
jgi:hypothetical protein